VAAKAKQVDADGSVTAQEIVNYYSALAHAVSLLEELPLSRRVILQTYSVPHVGLTR